jgi:hypothetical protein
LIAFFSHIVPILPHLCHMNLCMFYILWAKAPCSWIEWIKSKRNEIILVDRTNKEASFTGIAIPLTHSLLATITEKQSKYQELVFDNRQQWQLNKITVTASILAATRSSITRLTKASLPSIYRHPYCPRSGQLSH